MVNVKEKAKNAVTAFKAKAIPVMCAVSTAVPAMMISASAEGSSVDYTSVGTALKTGFTEIVSQCVSLATDIGDIPFNPVIPIFLICKTFSNLNLTDCPSGRTVVYHTFPMIFFICYHIR